MPISNEAIPTGAEKVESTGANATAKPGPVAPSTQRSKEVARFAKQLKALSGRLSTLPGGRGGTSSAGVGSASQLSTGRTGVDMPSLSASPAYSGDNDRGSTTSNMNHSASSTQTPTLISPASTSTTDTPNASSNSSKLISNKALFLSSLAASSSKSTFGKRSFSVSGIALPTTPAASPFLALPPPSPIPKLGPKTPAPAHTKASPAISKSSASTPPLHSMKGQVGSVGPKSMAEQAASSLTRTVSSGGLTTKLEVVKNDWVSTATSPKKRKVYSQCDRFIPNRSVTSMMNVQAKLDLARRPSLGTLEPTDEASIAYSHQIAEACGIDLDSRMLAFTAEPPSLDGRDSSAMRKLYSRYPSFTRSSSNLTLKRRTILTGPEKVLDAPGLKDDYYLNLMDWSCSNMIAIGLDKSVFLWDAETGNAEALMSVTGDTDAIASVSWAYDGHYLAVGTFDGDTQIWDVEAKTKVRSMTGHITRVGVLAWDKHILSSGCRDGSIWNHDVRVQNHKIAELLSHTNEVCGMAWRSDGQQLASGGNDNVVNIWDARSTVPKYTKTNHSAAVKAVAWCPWQTSLLATGGGTQDKQIHFWNSTTGSRVHTLSTPSQVTSIVFSTEYREFMSSHGHPDNNITVYGYPSMTKIANILAHDSRILHTALSPDGQTVATVSSDENLKFWKLFEKSKKEGKAGRRLAKSGSFGGFGGRGFHGQDDDDDSSGISGGVHGATIRGKTISSMTSIR